MQRIDGAVVLAARREQPPVAFEDHREVGRQLVSASALVRSGDAEHPGQARGMKAEMLAGALGSEPGAQHALVTGDKCGQEVTSRAAAFFRHCKGRDCGSGARMNAYTWLAQIVEFKGVRKRAVGERRGGCTGALESGT